VPFPAVNTWGIISDTMNLTDIAQLRAARSMAGLTQAELAKRSGVSLPTIKRLELGSGPLAVRLSTAQKLQRALEAAGVEFIPENGGGAGVRLRKSDGSSDGKPKVPRRRSRSQR
jgi:transcriptional regulator with XRE-family HTH domain